MRSHKAHCKRSRSAQLNCQLLNHRTWLTLAAFLQSDYYALAVVNCDQEQQDANMTGMPLTACPAGCSTGVTSVGANCTADFNYAYVKYLAATKGQDFPLDSYDPMNVLSMCGVTVDSAQIAAGYAQGQVEYLVNTVGAMPASCDATTLDSATYGAAKATCDADAAQAMGTCAPSCTAAIDIVSHISFWASSTTAQQRKAVLQRTHESLPTSLRKYFILSCSECILQAPIE